VPYLRLSWPSAALVGLGAACGAACSLLAGGILTFWQAVLPPGWVDVFDVGRIFEGPPLQRWALAALVSLAAPLCEEITFRGYLLSTLSLRRRPGRAIALAALLFAMLHLDPVRFPALLLAWRAGSLWPSIAAHAVNNGIAAGLLVLGEAPKTETHEVQGHEVLGTAVIGGIALWALLKAYRAASPGPESLPGLLALRDPSSPSIAWRPDRVPRALALGAIASIGALLLLGLLGLIRAG
jgi:membrane protease YdiL (CAAX protease family)